VHFAKQGFGCTLKLVMTKAIVTRNRAAGVAMFFVHAVLPLAGSCVRGVKTIPIGILCHLNYCKKNALRRLCRNVYKQTQQRLCVIKT